jgi:hypothetical protein
MLHLCPYALSMALKPNYAFIPLTLQHFQLLGPAATNAGTGYGYYERARAWEGGVGGGKRNVVGRECFPLTHRSTCIVFLLLKQSWLNLRQTPRSFLRCSSSNNVAHQTRQSRDSACKTQPGWMRVSAMEIMRRCVFLLSLIVRCQVCM